MLPELNKFEVGDLVYEITRPNQVMLITRRNGIIYNCKPYKESGNALVFIERDLKRFHINQEASIML